jgi:hypothetical protein
MTLQIRTLPSSMRTDARLIIANALNEFEFAPSKAHEITVIAEVSAHWPDINVSMTEWHLLLSKLVPYEIDAQNSVVFIGSHFTVEQIKLMHDCMEALTEVLDGGNSRWHEIVANTGMSETRAKEIEALYKKASEAR